MPKPRSAPPRRQTVARIPLDGRRGAVSSRSFGGALNNWPPLSFGEMMKTPMSLARVIDAGAIPLQEVVVVQVDEIEQPVARASMMMSIGPCVLNPIEPIILRPSSCAVLRPDRPSWSRSRRARRVDAVPAIEIDLLHAQPTKLLFDHLAHLFGGAASLWS